MVARLQKEVKKREGKEAKIIATGGFSQMISAQTRVIAACEPTLVLEGIRLIVERISP
jgi:pantothenate kinase type III